MISMDNQLSQIKKLYNGKINAAKTLKQLDEIFLEFLGKNGHLTTLSKTFSGLSKEQLKKYAPLFTQLRQHIEADINHRRDKIKEAVFDQLAQEKIQIDQPVTLTLGQGHLHPLTSFEQEIVDIFTSLGFQQIDAPEIDTDYNNFQVLNIPPQHPARDLWDTLYLDVTGLPIKPGKLLLRTHTSNAQIAIMTNHKPPIRMMNIGRCFRYENADNRHDHTFDQFELVYIDKNVSMANLQYLSEYFLKRIFNQEIKVRLRPKYYPFVEPGAGVDGLCLFCKGKGCAVCGHVGWLELAGAGMIHPTVLKNGGIDPAIYSGIAWGVGPERMVMLKYGVQDIRMFKSGDVRFLRGLRKI